MTADRPDQPDTTERLRNRIIVDVWPRELLRLRGIRRDGTIWAIAGLETGDEEVVLRLVEVDEWNRRREASGLPRIDG